MEGKMFLLYTLFIRGKMFLLYTWIFFFFFLIKKSQKWVIILEREKNGVFEIVLLCSPSVIWTPWQDNDLIFFTYSPSPSPSFCAVLRIKPSVRCGCLAGFLSTKLIILT